MKCRIQWINESGPDAGEATPDTNDACGLAVCLDLMADDAKDQGAVRAFPICEDHATRASSNWRVFRFDSFQASKG